LGEKSLYFWKDRILYAQIKSLQETEKVFDSALKQNLIAKDIKPLWLEWLVLTKGKSNLYYRFLLFYFYYENKKYL